MTSYCPEHLSDIQLQGTYETNDVNKSEIEFVFNKNMDYFKKHSK